MPARKPFKVGDRVVLSGKTARVERVERPSGKLYPTIDMGRYTLRYEDDGHLHFNAPGYLMARPGQTRRT